MWFVVVKPRQILRTYWNLLDTRLVYWLGRHFRLHSQRCQFPMPHEPHPVARFLQMYCGDIHRIVLRPNICSTTPREKGKKWQRKSKSLKWHTSISRASWAVENPKNSQNASELYRQTLNMHTYHMCVSYFVSVSVSVWIHKAAQHSCYSSVLFGFVFILCIYLLMILR